MAQVRCTTKRVEDMALECMIRWRDALAELDERKPYARTRRRMEVACTVANTRAKGLIALAAVSDDGFVALTQDDLTFLTGGKP
jgi:hypothetical protein